MGLWGIWRQNVYIPRVYSTNLIHVMNDAALHIGIVHHSISCSFLEQIHNLSATEVELVRIIRQKIGMF